MQYLFYILSIPFLFINYKIIVSDIKSKKIPNKYLGYLLILLPIYYLFYYFTQTNINIYIFFTQIITSFIVSFILYYYWVWAAWDAKYLLILSLFLPQIWIIPLVWNLSLITIIYLFIYFLWFYTIKLPLNKNFSKWLYENIVNDLKDKWLNYKKNKWWNNIYIMAKYLIIFLTFFVSFRLFRLYLLDKFILTNNQDIEILKNIIEKYNYYLVFIILIFLIVFLYIIKKIYNYFSNYLEKKYNINKNNIENTMIIIVLILLITYIWYKFIQNPSEITNNLHKILTFYIVLYLLIKILIYSYKVTFWLAESDNILISDLRVWDMVDKMYLLKLLWNQDSLKEKKEELYGVSPDQYFLNLKNPIDEIELITIQKSFEIVNNHQKINSYYQEINQLKILKTFAFWPYIFAWFIITFLFGNSIFTTIMWFIINVIKM